jgi:hypothetical protein
MGLAALDTCNPMHFCYATIYQFAIKGKNGNGT